MNEMYYVMNYNL